MSIMGTGWEPIQFSIEKSGKAPFEGTWAASLKMRRHSKCGKAHRKMIEKGKRKSCKTTWCARETQFSMAEHGT